MNRSRAARPFLRAFLNIVITVSLVALGSALAGCLLSLCAEQNAPTLTARNPYLNLSLAQLGNIRVTSYSRSPRRFGGPLRQFLC